MKWLNALNHYLRLGEACTVVTVIAVEGSAPRRVGTRMVVTCDQAVDTIGGGALELQAIKQARGLLTQAGNVPSISSEQLLLGPSLSQCCGGRVTLQFDYHPTCVRQVVVFGAGHVGQCLATILRQLNCQVTFYDSRKNWLLQLPIQDNGRGQLQGKLLGDNPFDAVQLCPDRACYVVMTHSHELDFELVEAILSRGDARYCGLIASRSKAQKFRNRLARKKFCPDEISRLTAPIGRHVSTGNQPMEIAVAAAADILACWTSIDIEQTMSAVQQAHDL